MDTVRKSLSGGAGGAAGTVVLSVLRAVLAKAGMVYETAPMQVVNRLRHSGLVADRPTAKRALALAAHFAYGTGAGAAFGALRRGPEDAGTEVAVGAALGVLLWGVGWAGWLPILGADRAPWTYHNAKVLLPILDHALYGTVWGLLFFVLSRKVD